MTMGILLGVFAVLLLCYVGIHTWNQKQDEKKAAKAAADVVYITDVSDVTAIKYDAGSGEMSFTQEDGTWYPEDDKEFPLDESYVKTAVNDFGKLKAERELTDGDNLASYGLDKPAYYVTMTESDGTETTVYIGNTAGDNYYASTGDKSKIYTVAGTVLDDLQYTLEDMAALDTFPAIGSGNMVKEEIIADDKTTVYTSENNDDAEPIATSVGGLSVLNLDSVADYSAADADLSKYGLDEKTRTTVKVTYTDSGDEEKDVTLCLGSEDGNGNRYVQLDGSKIVYLVTTEICNNILASE